MGFSWLARLSRTFFELLAMMFAPGGKGHLGPSPPPQVSEVAGAMACVETQVRSEVARWGRSLAGYIPSPSFR